MGEPSAAEQLSDDVSALQSELTSLQSGVRLATLRDSIEDLETEVRGLAHRVAELRTRGYVFDASLDQKVVDLKAQGDQVCRSVRQQLDQQAATLTRELQPLESKMAHLGARVNQPDAARPLVSQMQVAVEGVQNKISAAESTINGMYNKFAEEVSTITSRLEEVDWMLTQLQEASFQLFPTEGAIQAVTATWKEQGGDVEPEGVLYLTDQRLLFEQKQEVATKKFLFFTTESQKVQRLLLEVAVGQVENIEAEKKGFFGHEDHLRLSFASGASHREGHFHLSGQDCQRWQGLIRRAKGQDFDHDRVVPIDQATVARVRAAPTRCNTCGGNITQQIVRGMESIDCEYCGSTIRL